MNFGSPWSALVFAEGIMMRTATSAMMLNVEPTELKLASHLVGMLLMTPWTSMIKVVRRKVW